MKQIEEKINWLIKNGTRYVRLKNMLSRKAQNGPKHKQLHSLYFISTFSHTTSDVLPLTMSQMRLFEDECTKGALKSNAKAEKPDQFIAPAFTKDISEIPLSQNSKIP